MEINSFILKSWEEKKKKQKQWESHIILYQRKSNENGKA